jgi:hypothetical protein
MIGAAFKADLRCFENPSARCTVPLLTYAVHSRILVDV